MTRVLLIQEKLTAPLPAIVQKEEKIPTFHCISCMRCKDKRCDFFNRYVETDYNKCFNHSNYIDTPNIHYIPPSATFFKEIQNMEAQRIRELQKRKLYG